MKPLDSNMYYFGVLALDCFKNRLKEYPQYCHHLTAIEHFKDFPAHLIEWVQYGMQRKAPPGDPPTGALLKFRLQLFKTAVQAEICCFWTQK